EILEQSPAVAAILGSRQAKAAIEPDAPMPQPESESPHRPTGPRKRAVNEPGSLYTGPNIRVTMDADTFMVEAKRPLTTAEQDRLVAIGLDDVSDHQDGSTWLGPKTERAKAMIQQIAVEIDGKAERLAHGR